MNLDINPSELVNKNWARWWLDVPVLGRGDDHVVRGEYDVVLQLVLHQLEPQVTPLVLADREEKRILIVGVCFHFPIG